MSTATADTHADEHHDHPSDAMYWKIGGILGVLTLLEVGTYFITDDPYSHDLAPLLIGGLLALMVIKFITIISFFMHLKFDNRLFRFVFVSGLILAVCVYLVVLSTFAYFDNGYEAGLQFLS
ncbi:cytochrome C oxidase subunit IV family protein [Actinospongicola halichondriae]|uniref:cytochrome C oxidase subunit IV family protein n=1 Tax=Actinospongicola halichondriae TaxID=3236844 RepID=UPI003D475807